MQTIFYAGHSFLHRLNPLSKLLVSLPLMVFMLLTSEPWTPLAFILLTIVLLFTLGQVSLARLIRILRPMLLIVLFFLLLYPFLIRASLVNHTPLLFQIGPIEVYQGGVYSGLTTGLRVLALLLLSLPFSLTTDSADFLRALVQQWRLPYRLGYSTLAAFRFVPMLQTELAVIQAAQRVRGVNGVHGLRGGLERMRRYAVPLLATAIRQAERSALAMEGRAFGAFADRTYFRKMRSSQADWLFVTAMWALSILIVLALDWAGLLGPLELLQIL
ncbi:MAG: energy-coupling factor transporter transmembrane component T [Anaerolineales bacterium]